MPLTSQLRKSIASFSKGFLATSQPPALVDENTEAKPAQAAAPPTSIPRGRRRGRDFPERTVGLPDPTKVTRLGILLYLDSFILSTA